MRRTLALIIALFCISSCVRQGDLQPADVLHRASLASQQLKSAHFVVTANVSGDAGLIPGNFDGQISATGDMENGGNALTVTIHANGKQAGNADGSVEADADIIVTAPHQVYMKLNQLSLQPENPLLPNALIGRLLGKWWSMPGTSTGADAKATSMTPDPTMLRMQTEAVTVTLDHGLTGIHGRNAYLYDVTIDKDKLQQFLAEVGRREGTMNAGLPDLSSMSATGHLWIDADSFFIHRIQWTIVSSSKVNPLHIDLTVDLTHQNDLVTIAPPPGAEPFPIPSSTNPQ